MTCASDLLLRRWAGIWPAKRLGAVRWRRYLCLYRQTNGKVAQDLRGFFVLGKADDAGGAMLHRLRPTAVFSLRETPGAAAGKEKNAVRRIKDRKDGTVYRWFDDIPLLFPLDPRHLTAPGYPGHGIVANRLERRYHMEMARETGFDQNRTLRGAGILLPVSSLPGPYGIGTMGAQARRFVDYLRTAGQQYWQILPIGPTDAAHSPYQSPAAFAGNHHLIDLDTLCEDGLLETREPASFSWGAQPDRIDYQKIEAYRPALLRKAYRCFQGRPTGEYLTFCQTHAFWLEDYALFMALKDHFQGAVWQEWEEGARHRHPAALERYRLLLREEIDFWRFTQFMFSRQWQALKDYANAAGLQIVGDIPLYVSGDSADCWVHRTQFPLDEDGYPRYVGGVPPDEFADEGQNWNSPVYDWPRHRQDGFTWWRARMARAAEWYDVIRIDHFIGLSRYFRIPGIDAPATRGHWHTGPGKELLHAISRSVPSDRLIAEDLGIRNPETDRLLSAFGIPGMKVLQFAFDGNPENPHLPHNYEKDCVVYGGTHDNEPLAAFYENRPDCRAWAVGYLNRPGDGNLVWDTIRLGMASTANRAIFQMQDYLELGNDARVNRPGTVGLHNWTWRLTDGQLTPALAQKIRQLTRLYGR